MPYEDNRFKKMVEDSPDWFWEFDEHANFTYASPRIRDLLGYEPDELIGVNAFDLMDTEEAKRVRRHFDPIVKKYLPFHHLINTNIHKDGHEVIIESSGTPIFDEEEQFRGYRGIDRDITDRKRTEDALRESTENFISLADNIPGHVAFVNANKLHYQFVNGAFETSFGLPKDEIIGSHIKKLLGEKNYQHALPYIEEVRSGKSVSYENTFDLVSGTRWIQVNYNPIFDTNGHVASIAVLSYDITARKQAEEELQQSKKHFKNIIAQSPVPIVITDAKGDLQFFNNKFSEIFGYTLDDLSTAEQWWVAAYPDEDYRHEVQAAWEVAIKKAIENGTQIETQEWEITCKNGAVRCVEFDMMPLGDISVIVMNDITDRNKAEAALKASNEELDAFVRTIAHDLRTPVTPIMGYAEILREKHKDQFDKQSLTFLEEIENAGEEILAFIGSLLSLAQSGNMKRPAELVSTDEVVTGVIKNLAASISSAGVVMQTNPLPSVHVPKTFLIQIFDNLIGNAIRYAGTSGGLIEVGGEQNGQRIRFFVRDQGPGLSKKERKHIFEIFYRGTNKGEVKGSGIGLAIVYKIARNCGGRTWVEETPGGGCTFWVELEDVAQH